ncbi:PhoX family phosphatase [Falsarthrobacter nasiphocae]|uniref:Secreted PhoX family phosphatase n=1 Tax=Falsarthrobacter nasiphocae TaxID=189863 RepID=A0AAE3YIL3_9MICC|nr:PhoX family phosphatase [Falsarthrobacter nasiphocae]MDR6892426.1 secreted PhoX family phosphatase [Falsarthrobacter nasiphocae]
MAIDRLLPMLGHTRGKRSPVTCALKCDNACAGEVCNTSKNSYFRDIVSNEVSRRTALGAGAAAAFAATVTLNAASEASAAAAGPVAPAQPAAPTATVIPFTEDGFVGFQPIAPVPADRDQVTVPANFTWTPIIRWGDPLFADAPEFDPNNQCATAQSRQFGYNNDYTTIMLHPNFANGLRGVMFVNHEYTNPEIMVPPSMDKAEARAISQNAHGLTVVELVRETVYSPWRYIKGGALNRRFLLDTTFELTGPAAGSDLVKTKADPEGRWVKGTFANCSGGVTPWGTVLSGEENFHGYFVGKGKSAEEKRYGITDKETTHGWELDDPRFSAKNAGYENESHRFGYVVEVDPFNPTSTPKKRTALGRFKHEGANVIIAQNGKVVAYSGDDERFDYLYKFVSKNTYRSWDRAHNMTLLDEGDLYVAKFSGNSPESEIDGTGKTPSDGKFDGTGEWLPLIKDGKSMVPGMTVEQVAVFTRLAADLVGPTKMDRCEDVEPSLHTGKVYVACTNNSKRETADEVNPRVKNRDGHVVEITERGGDQTNTKFDWNLLLVAGDPRQGDVTYFSGFPVDKVSPISCPDNVAFDEMGNLWISTDGAPDGIGYADGLFRVQLTGPERGKTTQFLAVPREAETCGPFINARDGYAVVAVQHPGEDGTWADQHSAFPYEGNTVPRPAVIQALPVRRWG